MTASGETSRRAQAPGDASAPLRGGGRIDARFAWRASELALLFLGLPLAYALGAIPVPMILTLVVVTAGGLAVLLADPTFDRRRLRDTTDLRRRLVRVVLVFAVVGPALAAAVALARPELFLRLVRTRPVVWLLISVVYPVVSVYPQELVFRGFLFHRYKVLFPARWQMICASAAYFGFMHVVFGNVVAVVLSLAGGFLFAWTYDRTRSLVVVWVEHALYGWLVFTVGLGWYFFHGSWWVAEQIAR